jgi:hypothetical protein
MKQWLFQFPLTENLRFLPLFPGVWILAMSLAMPPLVGWGQYGYLPGQSFCFCQWRTSISYTFFMVGICFGGPCTIMSFCYMNILCSYRNSQRRIHKQDVTSGVPTRKLAVPSIQPDTAESTVKQRELRRQRKREEEKKLTKSLLIVIFVFILCWLPFCGTMFWSVFTSDSIPRVPDVISLVLGFANSCCNPIIYGLMNHRFRLGFVRLFKCRCFGVDNMRRFRLDS